MRIKQASITAALLAVLWILGNPALAEASVPSTLGSSRVLKTADPFATAPQLDLPPLAQQLRVVEEGRAAVAECVPLCELAAGIDAHPFGVAAADPPNRSEDAWGNYRFTGELTTSHNRFGFTGHYWDKESSLYYAKARYYDPFTARFTQSDSFLGNIDDPPSLHRYFYAHANPISYWDPTGHESFAAACQGYSGGCGNGGKVSDEEKAFGGVVYATGRGIVSIGQLTHDFTGTLLYGRGERLHEESALRFFGMVDQVGRRGIFGTIQDGFKRSFEDFNKGLDEGDAFAMGAAAGDAATNAVMIAEGGAGVVRIAVKTAPRAIAVTKSAARVARELSRVEFGLSELELARAVLAGRVRQIGSLGVGKIPTLDEARAIIAARGGASGGASGPRGLLPAGRTAEELRQTAGRAFGTNLPVVSEGQGWFRGSAADAGRLPGQIAEKLHGRTFASFRELREAIWIAVSKDPVLSKQFGSNSLREMQAGRAPFVRGSGRVGGRIKYEIDHMIEIKDGGGVYDLNNLIIRTPVNHIGKTP